MSSSKVESGRFRLVISPIHEREVADAPAHVRALFTKCTKNADIAPLSEEAYGLQEAYLSAGIVSPQWEADALHVAQATVSGCKMIVSWNFRHIVHFQKIPLYNAVNAVEGYSEIAIHTPQEVIDYEN